MSDLTIRALIDAGAHFGHRASRWNARMAPYIYGKRNQIHILDLRHTVRGILRATHFVREMVAHGNTVLFVGTKRQARPVILREAGRCGMPYVTERWLGGTLTNFETIRSRLRRLAELEAIERNAEKSRLKKKQLARIARERRKIQRNLEGIKDMEKLPGLVVIIDPVIEHIAVREAIKLNIPSVALLDTDCDPSLVDIPIPGNDDSIRTIEIVLAHLADAVEQGRRDLLTRQAEQAAAQPEPTSESPTPDEATPAAEDTPDLAGAGEGAAAPASPPAVD